MKNKKNKIIAALSVIVILILTACAAFFIKTYDFSLKAVDFELSNVNGAVCISWSETEEAEGYYIYKKHNNSSRKISTIVGNNLYYDEDVENAGEYTYSVVAFSSSGKSIYKNRKNCIYVDIPAITGCDNTVDGIVLKWSPIEKADGYRVYRKTGDSEEAQLVMQVNSDVTELCDNSVIIADTYYYAVVANIGEYVSGTDDEIKIDYISAPESVMAVNTVEGVSVTWEAVSTVEGYEVFRRSSENDPWALISKISDHEVTQFTDSNVEDRKPYEYKVNTYAGKLKSDYNSRSAKTLFIAPTVISGVELKENGFDVSWYTGSGVDGYVILRKSENETLWIPIAVIDNANQNLYTDTTVESGMRYSYSVSQNIGSYSSAYIEDDESKLFIATPELQVKNSPSGVRLTWTKAEGATEYRIYRKMSGDEKWETIEKIADDETVSYIDKDVTYGKKVRYKIKAWVDEENQSLIRKAVSLYAVDPDKPMVALTYDDGPYRPVTNSIIKTLKKHDARATFFIVGSRVAEFEDCIRKADKIGCEIANHTFEHTKLTGTKKKTIRSEVSKTNKAVEAIIGKSPALVRAPGGAVDDKVKKYVEYPLINWSVDTLDWKYRNSKSVISKVKEQVEDGSIVLMHDLYKSTAEASKTIIPWLIDEGYQLVTVSEMMDAKGINIKKGELYTSAE